MGSYLGLLVFHEGLPVKFVLINLYFLTETSLLVSYIWLIYSLLGIQDILMLI